ncbi:MAG: leucine-rich repeat domain-containing protein [Bdellovibrionales bacterium]|nr:leucine-rich repeat domain-containing protein [Bdellovibrionales bacterium]
MIKQNFPKSILFILFFIISCNENASKLENQQKSVQEDIQEGICNRTPVVQQAILDSIKKVDCSEITAEDLKIIKELTLSSQQLEILHEDDFSGLNNLEILVLHTNHLSSLPMRIFSDLTSLKKLFLNHNQLSSLPLGIFANLTSLTNLSLSHNQLVSLPEGIFADLTALETLRLHNNQLSSLSAEVFLELHSLKEMSISNNNIPLSYRSYFKQVMGSQIRIIDGRSPSL